MATVIIYFLFIPAMRPIPNPIDIAGTYCRIMTISIITDEVKIACLLAPITPTMIKQTTMAYVENDYDNYLNFPCHLDIGDLFFDGSLQNALVKRFGFEKIAFESRVEYVRDDFRHKDGKNFKEILKDAKVPNCEECINDECLIENERF